MVLGGWVFLIRRAHRASLKVAPARSVPQPGWSPLAPYDLAPTHCESTEPSPLLPCLPPLSQRATARCPPHPTHTSADGIFLASFLAPCAPQSDARPHRSLRAKGQWSLLSLSRLSLSLPPSPSPGGREGERAASEGGTKVHPTTSSSEMRAPRARSCNAVYAPPPTFFPSLSL